MQLVDQYNNPVSGQTVGLHATDGQRYGSVAANTNSSGQTQVNWTLGGLLSGQSVVVSFAALPTVTFTVTVQLPGTATISVTTGNNQTPVVNVQAANQLCATVHAMPAGAGRHGECCRDARGHGSVIGESHQPDHWGERPGLYHIHRPAIKAQVNTVTASIVTTGGTVSTSFTETSIAGAAFGMSIVSGDAQSGAAGSQLGAALVVLVVDQYGNPVSGVTPVFTPNGGGSVSVAAATASNGRTQVTWTLSNQLSGQTVGVTLNALTPLTFNVTVQLPGGATVTKASGDAQSATVATQVANQLCAQVNNSNNRCLAPP